MSDLSSARPRAERVGDFFFEVAFGSSLKIGDYCSANKDLTFLPLTRMEKYYAAFFLVIGSPKVLSRYELFRVLCFCFCSFGQ